MRTLTYKKLISDFNKKEIDYTSPGFYDHDRFLMYELKNPSFLNSYAALVNTQTYNENYMLKAKTEIPIIASLLNEELIKDGRLGACIDVSMVLSRILEKENYWNYLTKGSLTINFPSLSKKMTKYLWSVDFREFQAAHCWVVAPPFTIIDLTVKQQVFYESEGNFIPNYICEKSSGSTMINEIDIISPKASKHISALGVKGSKLEYVKKGFTNFVDNFPAKLIEINGTKFKYCSIAISASDMALENIRTLKLKDKLGLEIYQDLIIPKLKEVRLLTLQNLL